VFPGDTLRTDIWKLPNNQYAFTVSVEERNEIVISHGLVIAKSLSDSKSKDTSVKDNGSKASKIIRTLERIFQDLPRDRRADLMKKGTGIYRFDLKSKDGSLSSFYINLKEGDGSIGDGAPSTQDITIELAEETFIELLTGQTKGQSAFMKGLVKVKGNMMLATKLDVILSALGAQFKSKL
jgi:putative sterol carrier protein